MEGKIVLEVRQLYGPKSQILFLQFNTTAEEDVTDVWSPKHLKYRQPEWDIPFQGEGWQNSQSK